MAISPFILRYRIATGVPLALAELLFGALPLRADLLVNLQSFPDRIAVGNPNLVAPDGEEGPKGIASADFNADAEPDLAVSNLDGSVTILLSLGGGRFAAPRHILTGAKELRSVLAADLNGDGKPDLATASPEDGKLLIIFNEGGGSFSAATPLQGWMGVRTLASGDFDGDGTADLAAAGPGLGVRHFRGTGGGAFEIMGDLRRLSPHYQNLTRTRPVYTLRTLRSRDGLRDELLVTHADSPSLWILSTVPVDRRNEPPVNTTTLPAWGANPSPVLITEAQVHNATTLLDADGTGQPWVELLNKSAAPVNLAGWTLRLAEIPEPQEPQDWFLPDVTVQPGRFLIVFLSGKNRTTGPELHTSIVLKEDTDFVTLLQPNAAPANTLDLPAHTLIGVSRGLAPGHDEVKWFDLPSPGAENNAGETNIEDVSLEITATLTITPREPGPTQSVRVTVTTPEHPTGSSSVRNVWFSATPGLAEEHHLMHRVAPNVYEEILPPGSFVSNTPHRVLARLRDGRSNDYTVGIHPGLDEPEAEIAVPPRPGCLLPVASTPSPKVKSFELGPIVTRATQPGTPADLVFADEADGLLSVHRAGAGARRFEAMPVQSVQVGGLLRDVKLANTNGDGWLDATVVLRSGDLAVTLQNEAGQLRLTGELDTGGSPREAVMADFTGDGRADAAVINRYSADISILRSADNASGLVSLDQIYSVDGDVAALIVKDLDGKGGEDVLQLHRASGEISVRYAEPDGRLSAPVFTAVGSEGASALAVADVNNDGRPDVVTANLGRDNVGSISILLGNAGGGFEAATVFPGGGGMFAICVADFDGDGNKDVVAGLFDCTVRFFLGDGQGNLSDGPRTAYALPVPFVNESRVMVTTDFNKDGYLDVVGAGYDGDMVTLENPGATAPAWRKRYYPPPVLNVNYAADRIGLTTINADTDPDLIIGTARGVVLYRGLALPVELPGLAPAWFALVPSNDTAAAGMNFSVSDVLTADIDGDGVLDMLTACRDAACLKVLSRTDNFSFEARMQVDVPSARYLATGDLDGDGKPDLVGTGDVLWTVLSSRPPQIAPPDSRSTNRRQSTQVVINEVLARNTGVSVSADGGQHSDFIEIFNGTGSPAILTGWKLRVESTQEGRAFDETWTLPETTVGTKGRVVIVCSELEGDMHTGFNLPAEGGTITLLNNSRSKSERVVYPHAQENVSWSRYQDGHPAFHADPIPSPGLSNLDNGTVPPDVKLTPPSPATVPAGLPITFTARGRDDLGIVSMSLIWSHLDAPLPNRLILYDDGRNGDGGPVDGLFAGRMPALPAGAEVQFYLEAVDLSGEVLRLPQSAELSAPGDPPVAWSFAIATAPTLEISEVCDDNVARLRDETGGHPDYVRVRNTGTAPVDLGGILLAKSPLSEESVVYAYPAGLILPPGGEITVFADGNPDEGPLHAPFALDAGGDDVSLLAVRPSGARLWIHSVSVPAMAPDARFMRLPGTNFRAVVASNADLTNWAGVSYDADGIAFATVHFQAATGVTYRIEGDAPGAPVAWTLLQTIGGNGSVITVTRPLTTMAALRVVASYGVSFRLDAAIGGIFDAAETGAVGTAGIYGEARGVTALTLYYGKTDGFFSPAAWSNSVGGYDSTPSLTVPFAWFLNPLTADTLYYYRVKYDLPGGGVGWFPASNNSFRTLKPGAGAATWLTLTQLNPTNATVQISLNPLAPPDSTVDLVANPVDLFSGTSGWQRRVRATPSAAGGHTWTATLGGLERDTNYFVRAIVTSSTGQVVSAQRLTFRTPSTKENLLRNLLLTEIMYNPSPPAPAEIAAGFETDDFEFLELQNVSDESLDLSGLWFTGIAFDFPPSGAPVIPPGGFAVIAANHHAFAMRYGADIPLAGWTVHPFRNSRLSDGGEAIALRAVDGQYVFNFEYDDKPFWTDGRGYSLEFHGPVAGGPSQNFANFRASPVTGGTPGEPPLPSPNLTFPRWRTLHFNGWQIDDPTISGLDSDPDADGLTNLTEYGCGTGPLTPDSPDVLSVRDGGYGGHFNGYRIVLLTFPMNPAATDVVMTLESNPVMAAPWNFVFYHSPHPPSEFDGSSFQFYLMSSGLFASASERPSADGKQIIVTAPVIMGSVVDPALSHSFYRLRITKQ